MPNLKKMPNIIISYRSRKAHYQEIINARKNYCLSVLDEIIGSPPKAMRQLVDNYEKCEERWRKSDEEKGFCFEIFEKQNIGFLQTLQSIVDEMEKNISKQEADEKKGELLLQGIMKKEE